MGWPSCFGLFVSPDTPSSARQDGRQLGSSRRDSKLSPIQTVNDSPQPQLAFSFGLLKRKVSVSPSRT